METEPDRAGRFKRVRILATDFKYPYIRVEEEFVRDPDTGEERLVSRREMVADHVLVKLREGATEADLKELNRKFGAGIRKKMFSPGLYLVQLPEMGVDAVPEAVEAYNREASVIAYSEPDYMAHARETVPDDPRFDELYGLHNTGQSGGTPDADIDAPEIWDILTGGDVVVGVIDTGIEHTHEDLIANMWINPGEVPGDGIDNEGNGFIDDIHGWDFLNDDNDPIDDNSHGTHVAGTIAAAGNNGLGVAGVNWKAKLMALKFLGAGGSGPTSDGIDALAYAIMMRRDFGVNVRLTSNSWGSDAPSLALADMIAQSADEDMLFVAAAGNDARDTDATPHFPSSFTNDNIISVAATDRNDSRAGFSNFGAVSVDLGAPGVSILSTVLDNGYGTKSGTSMATPHVSGVAALLWNFGPAENYREIRDVILIGIDPIPALDGITVTGGRLNALKALENMGMRVRTSTPANAAVVAHQPTDFVIEFTDPHDPATLQVTDLTVNDLPADAVAPVNSNTVTFQFIASPVTEQGAQTMHIDQGAILSASEAEPIGTFDAVFRYDVQPMEVASTAPATGTVVTLPFTSLVVHLNEPYDPDSVDINDILLTPGRVTSTHLVDADAIEYRLAEVVTEGVLSLTVPEGSWQDTFQNPSAAFFGSFDLDAETQPYPEPFALVEPVGSLVYDPVVEAFIVPAGDTDDYTLDLDAGQLVSVLVRPEAGLQATVALRDPGGALIGQATAAAAGEDTLLQHAPAAGAGTYTLRMSGAGGSTGAYSVEVFLNATLEAENHGGAANDSVETAQDLDGGFLNPGGSTMRRAAVLGAVRSEANALLYEEDFETGFLDPRWSTYASDTNGRIRLTGEHGTAGGSRALLMDRSPEGSNTLNEAIWTIDLAGLNEVVLRFSHASWKDNQQTFGGKFKDHTDADGIAISEDGTIWQPVWSGPGGLPIGEWEEIELPLGDVAADAGMNFDRAFHIKFQQFDNTPLTTDGRGWDDLALLQAEPAEDWYRLTLGAGERLTLALTARDGKSLQLELRDDTGALLDAGTPETGDVTTSVRKYVAAASEPHWVRVAGAGESDYTLVATIEGKFELEPNDSADAAQDITGSGSVLGAVSCPPRLYAFDWRFPQPGIVKQLNPASGAHRRQFNGPWTPVDNTIRHNLASDGQHLWHNGGSDEAEPLTIFKLDAATGAVVDSFVPDMPVPTGLAWLDGELFASVDGGEVYVFDETSFEQQRILAPAIEGVFHGLEGDPVRGVLWAVSSFQRLYKIDPLTGAILAERNYAGEREGIEQGIAVLCDELIVSEATVNQLAFYDADTLESLRRVAVPGIEFLSGLAGFNEGPPEDWYRFRANAGDALVLSTATPAGEPQEAGNFNNTLDPKIELYDPAGALAAENDNGGPDGKNAELHHTALMTGYYAVRVIGALNTRGEYVLSVQGSTATVDDTPPSIDCPSDTSLLVNTNCTAWAPDFTASVTVTDDVSAAENILVRQRPASGTPLEAGTHSISLTAHDEAENTASCSFVLEVFIDTQLALTPPPDVTLECDEEPSPSLAGEAIATDLCDAAPVVHFTDAASAGPCGHASVITRSWVATNAAGNTASAEQTIHLQDRTPPILTLPGTPIAIECEEDTSPASTGFATAVDNCDPAPEVTFSDTTVPGDCPHQFQIVRTWTASDDCANQSSQDQIINVVDTTPPTLTVPANVPIDCTDDTSPDHTGFATATDNCDPAPVITFSDTTNPGSCPNLTLITRAWTATDVCGNVKTVNQTITVEDTDAPSVDAPGDVTLSADSDTTPAHTGTATVNDACDSEPTLTFDDHIATNGNEIVITRTWTGTDTCGNLQNEEQVITVTDVAGGVVTAAHASAGYRSPGTNTVATQFSYPSDRQLQSLLLRPSLSNSWSLGTSEGDGAPEIQAGEMVFTGPLTNNPITVTYTVITPSGLSGTNHLPATMDYQLNGMINPLSSQALPDPLPLPLLYELAVESLFGQATPTSGTHRFPEGTVLDLAITGSPVSVGAGTQAVATGWTGTGSVPAGGTGTGLVITLTRDSSIAWQWTTQHLLVASAGANGRLAPSNGWFDAGITAVVTATAATGYHFGGWSGDVPVADTNDNPLELVMDRARTIAAEFAINVYTIQATSAANGSIAPSGNVTVEHGADQPFAIAADAHYHIDDVLVDGVSVGAVDNYLFEAVATDHTISASFAIDRHTLEIVSALGNTAPPTGVVTADFNSVHTLSVTGSPVAGGVGTQQLATGWSGTGSVPAAGTGTTVEITLTSDSTIIWNWSTQYLFTATNEMGGTASASNGWHNAHTLLSATAAPLSGFQFALWTGDVPETASASDNPIAITLDRSRTLVARFVVNSNTLFATQSSTPYASPQTDTVFTSSFTYPTDTELMSLQWSPLLPPDWTLLNASGEGGPEVADTNIVFTGDLTNNPIAFSFQVDVPPNEPISNEIRGVLAFELAGMGASLALHPRPDPLPVVRRHSADFQAATFFVDGTEINRPLAYWRAGGYFREPLGADGFAPTNAPLAGSTNLGLHSADFQGPPWVIDGTELNRVLAYWRAGGYELNAQGLDGYAPLGTSAGSQSAATAEGITIRQHGPDHYNPDDMLTITNIFSFTNTLLSLAWRPQVPGGWTVLEVHGDGGPEFENGEIVWTGVLPPNPIEMTYKLRVPLWELGSRRVHAEVEYQLSGAVNPASETPEPAVLAMTPRDTDGDGLFDGWENHYSGDATAMSPTGDEDKDGVLNIEEQTAGTNPTNSESYLRVERIFPLTSEVTILWDSVTNRVYGIGRATNLLEGFSLVATNLPATPPTNVYNETGPPVDLLFYQLEVEGRD